MTQPISIMLDLETYGTEPGCDIRSIGAVVFDPVSGTVSDDQQFYIACDNPQVDTFRQQVGPGEYIDTPHYGVRYRRKYPLHRDERTVQWWSEQSDEAQAAFADPVDLYSALRQFTVWLWNVSGQPTSCDMPQQSRVPLWSHGAHFDGPILAAAYKAVGLPVPWHYRAPRDTRTAFDMAGIDDHSAWLAQHPGPMGVVHHALDDAICQARAVCGAWERIREPVRIAEQFGDRVCDVFDQMQKGNWRDDLDHDVRMNKSMLSLKDALEQAVAWREPLQ